MKPMALFKSTTDGTALTRWTRDQLLTFEWTPFESPEKLVISTHFREKIEALCRGFAQGEAAHHAARLSWRRGVFLFGPSGSGKTAASRAIARILGWEHFTIPAHEVLDSHLLEHALSDAIASSKRVIVLEDVDLVIQRMDPEIFFTLLDHAQERADGTFWIATSRRPENSPKTQLVRPGRFEESIRTELPSKALRRELLMNDFLVPYYATVGSAMGSLRVVPHSDGATTDVAGDGIPANPGTPALSDEDRLLGELVEQTEGLGFSHFEEMRQIGARLKLDGQEARVWEEIQSYIQDQIIAGDRWGGISETNTELEERIRHSDSRILSAAMDMTDVFRTLMEKVIGDAAEKARTAENEQGTNH